MPPVSPSASINPIQPVSNHSPRESRVVCLNVDVRNQGIHNYCVPRDERQICDRHFVLDKILLLREHLVQHAKHPLDLVVVPLDRARQLLGVETLKPRRLAKVRTASPPQRQVEHFGGEDTLTLDPKPGRPATAALGTCPGRCSIVCGLCRTYLLNTPGSPESP